MCNSLHTRRSGARRAADKSAAAGDVARSRRFVSSSPLSTALRHLHSVGGITRPGVASSPSSSNVVKHLKYFQSVLHSSSSKELPVPDNFNCRRIVGALVCTQTYTHSLADPGPRASHFILSTVHLERERQVLGAPRTFPTVRSAAWRQCRRRRRRSQVE